MKLNPVKLLQISFFSVVSITLAVPAHSQDSQSYQDDLFILSETLGRIHAIRVTCNGQSDQYWRRYMMNFLDLEAPTPGYLRSRMVERFNSAFSDESNRHPKCTVQATQTEQELSERGQQLTDRLSASINGF